MTTTATTPKASAARMTAERVVSYYDTVCVHPDVTLVSPVWATAQALASSHADAELAAVVLDRFTHDPPAKGENVWRDPLADLERALAECVHTDGDVLERWVHTAGDYAARRYAAANPALGAERVEEMWSYARIRSLLANPAMHADTYAQHWHTDPERASLSPHATTEILSEIHEAGNVAAVVAHPRIDREILRWALVPGDPGGQYAAKNPTLTLEQLRDTLAAWTAYRDEHGAGPGVEEAIWRLRIEIDRRLVDVDELAVCTTRLHHLDVVTPLAAHIDGNDTAAAAVASLLRAGFAGTVGELIDVSSAVAN